MEDQERLKLRTDLHKAYMEEFNRREAASSDNYDKAILGYSTGALALSVTFISTVVKDMAHAQAVWSLKASWVAWVFAIMITIVSFLVSMRAGRVEAEKASCYYNDDDPKALDRPNHWADWLTKITVSAGVMFALGAALMMMFVWANLGDGEQAVVAPKKPDKSAARFIEGVLPARIAQLPTENVTPPRVTPAPTAPTTIQSPKK
jgi:hypothetical protein